MDASWSSTPPNPAALGGIGLLERAVSFVLGGLQEVTPRHLPHPTPCTGWDLRELLAHLDDSMLVLCEAAETGHIPVECPTGPRGHEPVRGLRDRARRLLEAWTHALDRPPVVIGGQPVTVGALTATGALEVVTHG